MATKKKQPNKKKTARKKAVVRRAAPRIVDPPDDPKLLAQALSGVDTSGPSEKRPIDPGDATPLDDGGDRAAAAKLGGGSPRGKGAANSGASKDPKKALDDLLNTDKLIESLPESSLVREILIPINQLALSMNNFWAGDPELVKRIATVADKLVDKYLPQAGPWALEISFVVLLGTYGVPKYTAWKAKQRAEATRPQATSKEQTKPKAPGIAPRDSRLDNIGG